MSNVFKDRIFTPVRLNTINIIIAYNFLDIARIRIETKRDEFVKKYPERIDAIKDMNYVIDGLHESWDTFRQMEINLTAANRRNHDLELICLKQQAEINELKRKTTNILDAFDSGSIEFVKK